MDMHHIFCECRHRSPETVHQNPSSSHIRRQELQKAFILFSMKEALRCFVLVNAADYLTEYGGDEPDGR